MADKLRNYAEIAEETAVHITDSLSNWTAFLSAVGRLYKWPYEDQLLIFAQRPDAFACADLAVWNRMGRSVRRDSRAIVLMDTSGSAPALRYVFEFSDTKSGANARVPWIWRYDDKTHEEAVSEALDREYGRSEETDMAARLEETAQRLSREYWKYHWEEIVESVPGSFLEEYDDFNVETAFCKAASVSITYALLSRCGLEPEQYFERLDFEHVFEFNTPAVVAALGCAVSQSTQDILRTIERAVKGYERQKQTERSMRYGTDVQAGGRLPDSGRGAGGAARLSAGQIRSDAQRLSAPAQASPLGTAVYQREAVSALPGNRGSGQQPSGDHAARTGTGGGRNGRTESPRSRTVDRTDEYLPGSGGRDYSPGTGVLLKRKYPKKKQHGPER